MLHSRLRPLPRNQNQSHRSFDLNAHKSPITTSTETDLGVDHDASGEDEEDPEDLFSCFLPHLLPDCAPSFHGNPGQRLLYSSSLPGHKELEIMVPGYPDGKDRHNKKDARGVEAVEETRVENANVKEGSGDRRMLFAHYVWSAALLVAEGIEGAFVAESKMKEDDTRCKNLEGKDMRWRVRGENIMELGAGAALPSVISLLAGAPSVAITDHPSSSALDPNGAILRNLEKNVPKALRKRASIQPHEWGDIESPFARDNKGVFTRIIVADCLWMGGKHKNLIKTLLWFMSEEKGVDGGRSQGVDSSGRAWVVSGFHTGRDVVVSFFDTAVDMGLEIEEIWERDINPPSGEDGKPVIIEREWKAFRENENERGRWHVMAVLKRKEKHGNGSLNAL